MKKRREILLYKYYFKSFYSPLSNGVRDKTQKTPSTEIKLVTRIMKEYFKEKKGE